MNRKIQEISTSEEEPNKTFRYKAIIETKTSINHSKSGFDAAEKIANTKNKRLECCTERQ